MSELSPRDRVLAILQGKPADRAACFSGMGNVVMSALADLGYRFDEIHADPEKMARAAASSCRLYGYECAVVPFDVCVEAEALGCTITIFPDGPTILYPEIRTRVITSANDMVAFRIPARLEENARVPVVTEAIRLLRHLVGDELPVGAHLLGPLTLAGRLMDLIELYKLTYRSPQKVAVLLDVLTEAVVRIARTYCAAGADYICIREMGATTDLLGPKTFEDLVLPPLQEVFRHLDCPSVLHICGNTNRIVRLMIAAGASAISVEARNDIVRTRVDIGPGPVVLGNLDSSFLLAEGTPDQVARVVVAALEAGVDGVWPSCDIIPTTPIVNLRAMVRAVEAFGREKWHRYRPNTST